MFPEAWDIWAIAVGIAVSLLASAIGGLILGGGIIIDTAKDLEEETGREIDVTDDGLTETFEARFDETIHKPGAQLQVIAIAVAGAAVAGGVTGRMANTDALAHGIVLGLILALLSLIPTKQLSWATQILSGALSLPAAALAASLLG